MITLIQDWLQSFWQPFHALRYVSVRAVIATALAFLVAVRLGKPMIAKLRRAGVGEHAALSDSAEVAKMYAAAQKTGTPTMGGVFWVAAVLFATLLLADPSELMVVNAAVLLVGMGVIGFLDDFIKWKRDGGRDGLSRTAKFLPSVLLTIYVASVLWFTAENTGRPEIASIYLPAVKTAENSFVNLLEWGFWGFAVFVAIEAFIVLACSHAVNVTDGLDGLAAGSALPAFAALTFALIAVDTESLAEYWHLPLIPGAGELAVMGGAVIGATAGFLWYNANPAQIFLGDSGSLPMGALLGYFALVSKQELALPLLALVFVIEVTSSFIQIAGFKITRKLTGTGRRLLPVAPIHHYWQRTIPEQQLVVRFWLLASIGAALGVLTMKLR
ncbi:MAG: phospho-N-acetylmuramoyl-pentapeptide-transferase [Planctomycetes bacterium]|nr:phospho-N-acetylmuramoyl-pentapeptide-transferase [Planctomycetota bacterium]